MTPIQWMLHPLILPCDVCDASVLSWDHLKLRPSQWPSRTSSTWCTTFLVDSKPKPSSMRMTWVLHRLKSRVFVDPQNPLVRCFCVFDALALSVDASVLWHYQRNSWQMQTLTLHQWHRHRRMYIKFPLGRRAL